MTLCGTVCFHRRRAGVGAGVGGGSFIVWIQHASGPAIEQVWRCPAAPRRGIADVGIFSYFLTMKFPLPQASLPPLCFPAMHRRGRGHETRISPEQTKSSAVLVS